MNRRFGIVGGLGARAGADLYTKLVQLMPAESGEAFDVVLEQHPFPEGSGAGFEGVSHIGRKLYVFDTIRSFERRGVDAVLLPCFISQTFLEELRGEVRLPVVSLMDALTEHVLKQHPEVRRLGVLASDFVRSNGLFERHFGERGYQLVYPDDRIQVECLMAAVYGENGMKTGVEDLGPALALLQRACTNLVERGAELILPGVTEISLLVRALRASGIPIVDPNKVYARYAAVAGLTAAKPFKIGIVGGVGPAATVDFMDKIVRNTSAARDQEHLKMVVENNPQIPDRTANLIGDGADPTIALYAACKRLEADEASLIAIPCNTAHAYVLRIQRYLGIPIVHMLFETRQYLARRFGDRRRVGLLATSGTIQSGVYHDAFADSSFELLVPDQLHQEKVMAAIYGENGVKAGFTEGRCREDLLEALHHLVARGAEVAILGCTELPLILSGDDAFQVGAKTVALLDPTEILARRCAEIGKKWYDEAPSFPLNFPATASRYRPGV